MWGPFTCKTFKSSNNFHTTNSWCSTKYSTHYYTFISPAFFCAIDYAVNTGVPIIGTSLPSRTCTFLSVATSSLPKRLIGTQVKVGYLCHNSGTADKQHSFHASTLFDSHCAPVVNILWFPQRNKQAFFSSAASQMSVVGRWWPDTCTCRKKFLFSRLSGHVSNCGTDKHLQQQIFMCA